MGASWCWRYMQVANRQDPCPSLSLDSTGALEGELGLPSSLRELAELLSVSGPIGTAGQSPNLSGLPSSDQRAPDSLQWPLLGGN